MCVCLVSFRRSFAGKIPTSWSSRSCSSLSIRRRAPSNGRGGRRNSSSIPGGHGTNWETTHLIEFNINMILKRMCLFMSTLPNVMKKHWQDSEKTTAWLGMDGISVTVEQWSTVHVLASKKVMSTGNEFTGFAGKSCTNIWSLNMSCDLRRSLVDKSCLLENSSLAECWEYVRHVVAPVPVLVPRVRARQSVSTHHFHGINNTVSFDHAGHKQAHAVTMNMYPGIMCANFTNINSWILKIAQRFKCQKKNTPSLEKKHNFPLIFFANLRGA